MIILAIDPGPKIHAWVMWDTEKHELVKGRCGMDLRSDIGWWENAEIDLVAIEFPQSYGNVGGLSLYTTAFRCGQIAQWFIGHTVKLYGRPTIKGQIGGRTDSEVNCSLRMRYGDAKKGCKLYGVKKDIWAALALAVALTERPDLKQVEIEP